MRTIDWNFRKSAQPRRNLRSIPQSRTRRSATSSRRRGSMARFEALESRALLSGSAPVKLFDLGGSVVVSKALDVASNDAFASAIVLSGASSSTSGSNVDATRE